MVNLYAAFGLALQVRLRAASFRQPDPDDLPDGESYPFGLGPHDVDPVAAQVLNPYEEAMQDFLEGKCVEIDEERIRHLQRTLDVPLDALTDYVLDIETVPADDPEHGERTIVHSVSFSTGTYPTLAAFVSALHSQNPTHRWVESGQMQIIAAAYPGTTQPEGAELDASLIGAGLEPMPVPQRPKVTVFWEQEGSNAPEPVALLIDAPEPMRRTWTVPTKEIDTTADPESEYWRDRPHVWLDLGEGSETPDVVDELILDPGGQRALVVLAPNMRGERVQIDLIRRALDEVFIDPEGTVDQHFPIFDLTLDRAPWEE